MAVVKAPFLSFEAHGSIGRVLTARLVNGKQVMSGFQKYRYSRSTAQAQRRDWFKALVKTNILFNDDNGFEYIDEIRPSQLFTDGDIPIRIHMSCEAVAGILGFWTGMGKLAIIPGTWGGQGRKLDVWECKAM